MLTGFSGTAISDAIQHNYPSGAGLQSLTVGCWNEVSGPFNNTWTITVVRPVSGVTTNITTQYARVNEVVTFGLLAVEGSHVSAVFDFTDDIVYSIPFCIENSVFVPEATFAEHAYTTVGNYTASVDASTPINNLAADFPEVYVQNIVPALDLTIDTEFVACPPGSVNLNILKLNDGDLDPTDIFLQWEIPGLTFGRQYITLPHSEAVTLSCAAAGDVTIIANVSNGVSYTSVNTTITMQAVIEGLAVEVLTPSVAVGEPVQYAITLTQGSPVHLTVRYYDGTADLNFMHSNDSNPLEPQHFSHPFGEVGNHTLEVVASNGVTTEDVVVVSAAVIVQRPLEELSLIAEPSVTRVGGTVMYILTVPNTVLEPPSNVHMVWTYGDGSEPEVAYTDDLSDDSVRRFSLQHTLLDSAIGNIVTTVVANNLISNTSASTTVTVQATIEGLEVDLLTPYAAINVLVYYAVRLTQGAPVQLTILYHDDTPDLVSSYESAPLEDIHFNRTYAVSGNYTLRIKGQNSVTDPDVVVESALVIIQAPLGELLLSVEPSIIEVGGTASFTLSVPDTVTVLPSNVHMIWLFEDDIDPEITYTDHLSDDSVRRFTIQHTFTATSINDIVSLVQCNNLVSNATASTTISIERRLSGLSVAEPPSTPVGADVTFDVGVGAGSRFTLVFDFGHGEPETRTIEEDVSERVVYHFTRAYPGAGNYDISVTANNNINTLTEGTGITIDTPVAPEDFAISCSPAISFTDDNLGVTLAFIRDSPAPLGLNAQFSLDSGTTWSDSSVITEFPHTHLVPIGGGVEIGTLHGMLKVSNLLTEIEFDFSTLIVKPMSSLELIGPGVASTADVYECQVTLAEGTNVNIAIDTGDDSTEHVFEGAFCVILHVHTTY